MHCSGESKLNFLPMRQPLVPLPVPLTTPLPIPDVPLEEYLARPLPLSIPFPAPDADEPAATP